jgi:hypothetical protein
MWSACVALASLLWGAQVPEPPPPVAVQWTAPAECPDAEAVRGKIGRRLGRALDAGEATLVAQVVREAPRGYVLRLRLAVGGRGEDREFSDPSCAALAEVVALRVVAAVAPPVVEAPAAVEVAPVEVAPVPVPAPAEVVVVVAAVDAPVAGVAGRADDVPRDRVKNTGAFFGLLGGGVLGVMPGPTGAVGLVGGLLGRRWRAALRGTFMAPRTVNSELGALQAGFYGGAVHGCGRFGRGVLEVPVCAGLEAGVMWGEARVSSGRRAFAGWLAVSLESGLVWHAGRRVGLWTGLELALAVVRPRFELVGEGRESVTLYRPPVASGRLWLGVMVRFGDPW